MNRNVSISLFLLTGSLAGCGIQQQSSTFVGNVPHYVQVTDGAYTAQTQTLQLRVNPVTREVVASDLNKDTILDMDHPDGVINYATANYPRDTLHQVRVVSQTPMNDTTVLMSLPIRSSNPSTKGNVAKAASTVPTGVRLDSNMSPRTSLSASRAAMVQAVMNVANSKLGTPYIWGHSEDRGQYGFDCSNFTAYVYHHALGYVFSGASRVQYSSVGRTVPVSQMLPGDLICFEYGRHVGIYAGGGRMIQEGGGLGKVGYLPLYSGTYWYNHISAVKRMF